MKLFQIFFVNFYSQKTNLKWSTTHFVIHLVAFKANIRKKIRPECRMLLTSLFHMFVSKRHCKISRNNALPLIFVLIHQTCKRNSVIILFVSRDSHCRILFCLSTVLLQCYSLFSYIFINVIQILFSFILNLIGSFNF